VAAPPHSFEHEEDWQIDAEATCANAFATAKIVEKAYTMPHLLPGHYMLRFFNTDGTVASDAGPIDVPPGQTVVVP
jgi:hypothetical protein